MLIENSTKEVKVMKPIKTMELNMPKPPSDVLWQRKDIMLVAAGSGPCLRELYYRAVEQGKLQQLMFAIQQMMIILWELPKKKLRAL